MELRELFARMDSTARRSGRSPTEIKLLPVSKGQSVETIRKALADVSLPRRLGENYLEELTLKRAALTEVREWHYIGRLQSRKIHAIWDQADMVHTVSRAKEISEIAAHPRARAVKFFIQVNVSLEAQKNGCVPGDLPALLESVEGAGLSDQVAGLMTLPASLDSVDEKKLRAEFASLRALRDRYLPSGELSMGMSDDFEIAIEEGSNWLRIGSAIFGHRAQRA